VATVQGMKYRRIVDAIRKQIVGGEYATSHRLPPWSQIAQEHSVGMATVQKAVDCLTQEGFLRAQPGEGTYVADYMPTECCFALALHPESSEMARLHDSAVRRAAESLENGASIQFRHYSVVGQHYREEIARLGCDMANNRVAGLISPFFNGDYMGTPVMTTRGVPRVFCADLHMENTYSVGTEDSSFLNRALEYVLSRGCRRIAHVQLDAPGYVPHRLEGDLRRRGVEVRPYWMQSTTLGLSSRSTTNMVRLLMELEGDKRPDALIVHDDALLDAAITGLLSCNVNVPDDLTVVSLANFPSPSPAGLPICRLGYDWREMLSKSIETIRAARHGLSPQVVRLPAAFEDELSATHSANGRTVGHADNLSSPAAV